MAIFTNSMLKDWKTCHNKFFFKYIKKIVIPKKEDCFELGKKVHALINYHLNGFKIEHLKNSTNNEVLAHYESILRHRFLREKKCFKSEWGFNVNIANTTDIFTGRIDAIFYDGNNFYIADWKTGMKIPQIPISEPQAQIYLYAFYKAQNDLGITFLPENLSFTFIQTPSLNESVVLFSQELFGNFEKSFLNDINEMKKTQYDHNIFGENKCEFCEYKFMCQKCV